MLNKSFVKLFFKPQFKFLAGKNFSNLIVLVLILTISMLSIGLGNGVVKYMKTKMESVYVSIIEVVVPSKHTHIKLDDSTIGKFHQKNHASDYKEYYHIKDEPSPNFVNYFLVSKPNGVAMQAKCQLALNTDPYIKQMNGEPGLLNHNVKFTSDRELGCIVSKECLEKLGYKTESVSFLSLCGKIGDTKHEFPIPVRAIAAKMPNKIDILLGKAAYNLINNELKFQEIAKDTTAANILIFLPKKTTVNNNLIKMTNEVRTYFDPHIQGELFKWSPKSSITNYNEILNSLNQDTTEGMFYFKKHCSVVNLDDDIDHITKENYAIKFDPTNMDMVEDFSVFLKQNWPLEVDKRVIEEKKNFDLFNKVAKLLSFALIVFSVFSMVLFITNLFLSHISKNRKNLGTLKAFGMSNNDVISVYSSISIMIVLFAFLAGYLISHTIGGVIVEYVASSFEISNPKDLSYDNYSFAQLFVFFVITPLIFVILKLFSSLHGTTPGDLIYER